MSSPNSPEIQIDSKHKYFVAMHYGTYKTEASAIAGAGLPKGSQARGEFQTTSGSAKLIVFQTPPRTTDVKGLAVLVIEPTANGAFNLWQSATDLARETKSEADDDVENFKDAGGGTFRVFERK